MKVSVFIEFVRRVVRLVGFINSMGRFRFISLLVVFEDVDIIKWYVGVGRRWFEFFDCCRNFEMVKIVVIYYLRFLCFLILVEKYEFIKVEIIRYYLKDLKVLDLDGNEEVYFLIEREVKKMGDGYFLDFMFVDGVLILVLIRLVDDESLCICVVYFCDRKDIVIYRVSLLYNRLNIDSMD